MQSIYCVHLYNKQSAVGSAQFSVVVFGSSSSFHTQSSFVMPCAACLSFVRMCSACANLLNGSIRSDLIVLVKHPPHMLNLCRWRDRERYSFACIALFHSRSIALCKTLSIFLFFTHSSVSLIFCRSNRYCCTLNQWSVCGKTNITDIILWW